MQKVGIKSPLQLGIDIEALILSRKSPNSAAFRLTSKAYKEKKYVMDHITFYAEGPCTLF